MLRFDLLCLSKDDLMTHLDITIEVFKNYFQHHCLTLVM